LTGFSPTVPLDEMLGRIIDDLRAVNLKVA
jgi:hypothetical protein